MEQCPFMQHCLKWGQTPHFSQVERFGVGWLFFVFWFFFGLDTGLMRPFGFCSDLESHSMHQSLAAMERAVSR